MGWGGGGAEEEKIIRMGDCVSTVSNAFFATYLRHSCFYGRKRGSLIIFVQQFEFPFSRKI